MASKKQGKPVYPENKPGTKYRKSTGKGRTNNPNPKPKNKTTKK